MGIFFAHGVTFFAHGPFFFAHHCKIVSVVDSFKIAKRFNYLINRSKSYKAIQTKYLNKIYDLFKNTLDYNFIDYFT